MSEPFIGEIRLVGFNFAPQDWAFCDGSLLAISQNTALFSLLGTTYGGDGQNTFALPDLRGRVPVHVGSVNTLGQSAGTETVTVTTAQLPVHTHPLEASAALATSTDPTGAAPSAATSRVYAPPADVVPLSSTTTSTRGGQAHANVMPFLCLNFIISLYGVYPSEN